MSPLEEATTDELILELRKRMPCLLLAGEKVGKESDKIEGTVLMYGPLTMAFGLHARLGRLLDEALADDVDDQCDDEE